MPFRDTNRSIQDYAKDGRALFAAMYGENADNVQTLLDNAYPDMGNYSTFPLVLLPGFAQLCRVVGWFSNTIGYGVVYGGANVLTQPESSFVIATANIAMGTPRQIAWHLKNAMNGGASFEEVQAVRKIAIEVASKSGVSWNEEIPEVTLS